MLPDWFEALNRDFRYQLTVIGQFAQAIVADEINENRFTIRTDKPSVKVSWQVTGVRQDAWAKENRIPIEVEKANGERGRYLHPSAHGLSKEMGVEQGVEKSANSYSPRD
jgi:trimeric autotransporter adhesin